MFCKIKDLIDKIFCSFKEDPISGCDCYKQIGCSHVDGILCDYPKCDMTNKNLQENERLKTRTVKISELEQGDRFILNGNLFQVSFIEDNSLVCVFNVNTKDYYSLGLMVEVETEDPLLFINYMKK